MRRKASKRELIKIWGILAYQFDPIIASSLLNPEDSIEIIISPKGKLRHIIRRNKRILTLRPSSGTFSISIEAAKIITKVSEPPRYRAIIKEDRDLKGSVLARDVLEVDPNIRPNDEVIVVNKDDKVVGVGRAKIAGDLMKLLNYGEVIRLREVKKKN